MDSWDDHIHDTQVAGVGLCDPATTRYVVENGKAAIDWLIAQGVPFSRDSDSSYHLTREGGHSHRRIIHAADATGLAVQQSIAAKVMAHPNITLLEQHIAIDLITGSKLGLHDNRCYGAYALNTLSGEIITISARNTMLATGGAGKVYLYTTNPDTATGDGIAMGWRAGCRVANMEFIQFHPTCLYHPHAKSFLISEAVRGEGGILKLPDGTRFYGQARCPRRTGTARCGSPRYRLRNENSRAGLRLSGYIASIQRVSAAALPQHLCALHGAGHRHHAASRSPWYRPYISPAAAS